KNIGNGEIGCAESRISMNDALPYLTSDLPGIGGQLKTTPDDFCVEEIPLYEPSGEGQHLFLTVEKRGMTTLKAVRQIARALKADPRQIGYAGLKDAQAVTRQTISVDGVSPDRAASLDLPGITIMAVQRHKNKLRLGHLAGNRFIIRVRGVEPEALPLAETVLARLQELGAPNYFGQQRFGVRRNTQVLGLALIQQRTSDFLAEFLGRPRPDEHPQAQRARAAFESGHWQKALDSWPRMLHDERKVLQALVKSGQKETALRALDRRLKRLYISAYQSYLFNQLLAQRLETLRYLEAGDVAYIHRNGACFVVRSAAREQHRVDDFEISPAGPLFGPKYLAARGKPGHRERALLQKSGVTLADFKMPGLKLPGSRRPYRVPLGGVDLRWDEGLVLSFTLPPGSYATTVMREVMKPD
ncbi:MAG: tRNA pseudouridine(13) synthase TruD, partial [Anaerolineae bacterium]